MTRFSFIVPVFNRPDEVDELLQSLTRQTVRACEVIVVEDGSQVPCLALIHIWR
uniref:glycosyltransferase family 2 protein n=1 Tax=Prevotella sp. TaxID=59823 RepID=UPI004025D718